MAVEGCWRSRENVFKLSISDEKMPLLTGKIERAYLVPNFCLPESNDDIPSIFFSNWEPDAQPKLAHAYYVFSARK